MIEQWYSENRYITALVLKRFLLCVQTLPDCVTASNDLWRLLDESLLDESLLDELTLWTNRLWTNRYWTNRYWTNCTRPLFLSYFHLVRPRPSRSLKPLTKIY